MTSQASALPATDFLSNPSLDRSAAYGDDLRSILSLAAGRVAHQAISAWDGYAPTPLRDLAALADRLDLGKVLYKDEGLRFGLNSFKALGGAYAVDRLVAARGVQGLTVACATDGNHGRSVAWGARRAGAKAVIYIHEGVTEGRAEAIRSYGATVVREGRTYDDSVRACSEAAARNGWQIVSDTSWPGYEDVPKDVMQGYSVMAIEVQAQQPAAPTHVFVQGGVGGLAAAVLSDTWERLGAQRPIFVVVEPETAACLIESARARAVTAVGGDLDTIMAGLACGGPSILAWRILQPGADAFMTIRDSDAAEAMRQLAALGVVGGESGVAGLAGLAKAAADPALRAALKLDSASVVLCYGTEGATDAEVYRGIVGRTAEEVRR
ncbi:diaminopropionate ammonia-lyase [Bosea sp. TWI1241]|uniref:diaminopropionate ammonia-lyase n=1 Tax=Bosea sp. TWI1241 TaxID=3148904 RepID=UPI00320B07C7